MPTISVITAAYAPTTADYIGDTARSIAEQHLPRGWSLEWVVQEDGDHPSMGDDVSVPLRPLRPTASSSASRRPATWPSPVPAATLSRPWTPMTSCYRGPWRH